MPGFIKSHSNYRLQTRHQTVDGGVILERDISTVGGVNTFATGQATVYQSGNFVIVVNNGNPVSRHVRKNAWLPSFDGTDTWDAESIEKHESDIEGSVESKITLKNDFMDLRSFAYYGSLSDLVENTVCTIIRDFPYEIYLGDSESGVSATTYEAYNPGGIDIITSGYAESDGEPVLGSFNNGGYLNYEVYEDGYRYNPCPVISWSVTPGYSGHCEAYSTPAGESFPLAATVEIKYERGGSHVTKTIYALYNRDGSLYYNWRKDNKPAIHIRPKEKLSNGKPGFYDAFIDRLDLFGKCLMGVYSGTKNVSKFEVLDTNDYNRTRTVTSFILPTSEGEYNVATSGMALERYIGDLGRIALSYDDYYTDNMYRMMTHESLKNLDWTRGFNGDDGSEYVKTGEKFKDMIRVMGYVFDQEKAFIDSIGNVNTVTYSERSNLSDYFLSDSLEEDGWSVNTIYPQKLTLVSGSTKEDVTETADYSSSAQTSGVYERSFSEITDISDLFPYINRDLPYYYSCTQGEPKMERHKISNYNGQAYYVVDGQVYNVVSNYSSKASFNIPEVNNEFEKRLRINSRSILRKKGTVEGIESLLSLFGMRSKRWVEAHKLSSSGKTQPYFDVEEFSTMSPYIVDSSDGLHEHRIDWYNSCKTIPYYINGMVSTEYIPYQGLPVAYRDVEGSRRLYPHFESHDVYDGGMYYQMKGGWLRYSPYRFGTEETMMSGATDNVETMRDVMLASDINELVSLSRNNLYTGAICYVNSTSGKFALINGAMYPLETDSYGEKYFTVNVYGGTVSVGGQLYDKTIQVSDGTGGETFYDLGLYADGYPIKVYYTGDRENAFTIRQYLYDNPNTPYGEEPLSSLIFIEGDYDGLSGNTNYFQLVDIDGYGKIGQDCWRQVKKDEELYRRIDSITDKYTGNNPHFGRLQYDNGKEYLDRYRQLFKYPYENNLFNTACFPDVTETLNEIKNVGFNLCNSLVADSKSHSFADTYDSDWTETPYDMDSLEALYGRVPEYEGPITTTYCTERGTFMIAASGTTIDGVEYHKPLDEFIINGSTRVCSLTEGVSIITKETNGGSWSVYSGDCIDIEAGFTVSFATRDSRLESCDYTISDMTYTSCFDGVTSQIINTKNIRITFYISSSESLYTKSAQEEIKYIQSVVMPYVEQVLPSSSIVEIVYVGNSGAGGGGDDDDDDSSAWFHSLPWMRSTGW